MAKGKAEPKKGDAKKGDKGDKEPKGAQQINVRHILVSRQVWKTICEVPTQTKHANSSV